MPILPASLLAGALVLSPGETAAADLPPGTRHTYAVTLAAGSVLEATVEGRFDLVLALAGPDGSVRLEVDETGAVPEQETLLFIPDTPGEYRLEVRSRHGRAGGSYRLRREASRPPTTRDQERMAALRILHQGSRA